MMVHDFKPETDEQKKERKANYEANRIFKSVSFNEATTRIAELLFKTVYYKKYQINKDNPKILGNVMFWIDYASDQPVLMYNTHPSRWDKDAVIMQLETEEYYLINDGKPRQ